jgi:accessory gene regulator B
MNILEKTSRCVVNEMRKKIKNMDDERCEIINYGLYVLLSDLVKISILLIISLLLGIFLYCIAAIAGFAVLRSFFGGVHSKTWLGCFISNTTLILGNVYLSVLISNLNIFYVNNFIYILCFIIVFLYVPADHENKPIESRKQRRLLRKVSFVALTIHYLVSVILLPPPFSSIFAISALISAVSTMPLVYVITANRHGDAYHRLS